MRRLVEWRLRLPGTRRGWEQTRSFMIAARKGDALCQVNSGGGAALPGRAGAGTNGGVH